MTAPRTGEVPERRFVRLEGSGDPGSVWRPRQVHGREIVLLDRPETPATEADAVLTRRAGLAVGVVTADCVPILLAVRPERGIANIAAVAAIHAGWRGLASGIVEHSLDRIGAVLGGAIEGGTIDALIGPAAGLCCYEVGDEVIGAVRPDDERIAPSPAGRTLLDLRGVATDRLVAGGLAPERIARFGGCTICSSDWPSYRRDGANAGRILAFTRIPAGCPPDTPSP